VNTADAGGLPVLAAVELDRIDRGRSPPRAWVSRNAEVASSTANAMSLTPSPCLVDVCRDLAVRPSGPRATNVMSFRRRT
jgi:hypothetical protein